MVAMRYTGPRVRPDVSVPFQDRSMTQLSSALSKYVVISLAAIVSVILMTGGWLYYDEHRHHPGDAPEVPERLAPKIKMDPMFVPYHAEGQPAFWFDNDHFMVSALPVGSDIHGEPNIYIGDVRTGHYKLIVKDALFADASSKGFLAIRRDKMRMAPDTHAPAQKVGLDSNLNIVSMGELTEKWGASAEIIHNKSYPESYSVQETEDGDLVKKEKNNWFWVTKSKIYIKLDIYDEDFDGFFFDKNIDQVLISKMGMNNHKDKREYITIDKNGNLKRNEYPLELSFYKINQPWIYLNDFGTIFINEHGDSSFYFNQGGFIKTRNNDFFRFWGGPRDSKIWAAQMQPSPNDCLLFLPFVRNPMIKKDISSFDIVNLCSK